MKTLPLIIALIFLIAASACKKNDTSGPSSDIQYRVYNHTISTAPGSSFSIDLDSNGSVDFTFSGASNNYTSYQVTSFDMQQEDGNTAVTSHLSLDWQGKDYSYFMLRLFGTDGQIDSTCDGWGGYPPAALIYTCYRDNNSSQSTAAASMQPGATGFYGVCIKKFNGGKYYGWIRVSLAADGNSIAVMDAAISLVADKPIKAGQK